MRDGWWYLSRATGIVALALVVAALVSGFFFSSRNTGPRRRPAWWLDLHNGLGGLALCFTVVHVGAAYLDRHSGIGVAQVFVPGTAPTTTWAIAWGVIATYLLSVTVLTSWPAKRLSPRVWRSVHLSSVLAAVLAGVHSFQAGTDALSIVFETALAAAAGLAVYALGVRVLALVMRIQH